MDALKLVPITSLPADTTPAAGDFMVMISGGLAYKVDVPNLRKAIDIVTVLAKGLMSATDKVALDDASTKLSSIFNPVAASIPSAASIAIPALATFVVITGTTTVTTVTGVTNYRPVFLYYPVGAGIIILGNVVQAGDPPLRLTQTAT